MKLEINTTMEEIAKQSTNVNDYFINLIEYIQLTNKEELETDKDYLKQT